MCLKFNSSPFCLQSPHAAERGRRPTCTTTAAAPAAPSGSTPATAPVARTAASPSGTTWSEWPWSAMTGLNIWKMWILWGSVGVHVTVKECKCECCQWLVGKSCTYYWGLDMCWISHWKNWTCTVMLMCLQEIWNEKNNTFSWWKCVWQWYFAYVIIAQRKQEIFVQEFAVQIAVLTCKVIIDWINYLTLEVHEMWTLICKIGWQ